VKWSSAYAYPTPNNKDIVYNVLRLDSGWRIEAFLPNRIPPSDRITVLKWFDSYANQVRAQHPQWNTRFRTAERAYFLDIRKLDKPSEVAKATKTLQNELWQQLNLDYAG
jgi:hypothetical protein